ncbi:MAG: hypothetical protein ISP32_06940 [Thermoleophilia bacterium]|nr:hypothetical protein [Thermoleophilia bacterium]
MADRVNQIEDAVLRHLRASGEPVREAFLFERVRADGVDVDGEAFIAVLMRMEVEGHVHVDPARDEVRDPQPFQPRFWRVIQ